PRKRRGGVAVIIGIVVFAGAVWAMFSLAPRTADRAPVGAKFGVPDRSIRIVACDLGRFPGGQKSALEKIDLLHPDIVLLQGVPIADLPAIGSALAMARHNGADVFYPAQNLYGPGTDLGNAIFARF